VTLSPEDLRLKPGLEFSKQLLDFNLKDTACPINTAVYDEVEVRNNSNQKFKFKFEPVYPSTCQISFSPATGTVDKGKSKKIKAKLILLSKANLNFKITLKSHTGEAIFLNLRVSGETGVFGVDPSTLELVDDGGHKVPIVLAEMKKAVIAKGGIKTEGIFRLAGETTEIRKIKEQMNRKNFDLSTGDLNAIASLLKIWFRELPVPILNAIPQETIMNFSSSRDCVEAYESLPEPQKTLLRWLMDFLAQVSANSEVNKMTSQNLAIVVAPNLYDISTPNPMEGLILSQKCAQFLNHVLNSRVHQH